MTEIYDRGMDALRAALGRLLTIAERLPSEEAAGSDDWEALKNSLAENSVPSRRFPVDVIHDEIHAVLAARGVAEEKRSYLIKILKDLLAAPERELLARAWVSDIGYDSAAEIDFSNRRFCLTGDFIHGPRRRCDAEIRERGGLIAASVSQRVDFLVVGSLGSVEWKRGNFGAKIERAMYYKGQKLPMKILREAAWRAALK
jgi:NAD-dependent DNA ligase